MAEYDITDVDGYDTLISRMQNAESVRDWSFILSDYLQFGNNKIAKSVGIFNMGSASDCPNRETRENGESETGYCQVPWESCYAGKAERMYPQTLPYRRRQEFLWDCLDAETFAKALESLISRKRNDVTAIRFSEAGDFRHRGDIIKVNRIAELIDIPVYTYSASHKLDWSLATCENFTVNQSNNFADYGDRLFSAVPTVDDIPDDAIFCPFEAAKENGVDTENRPKCGDCTACIEPESKQSRDVYITIH